jgi:hypothetical protein
MKKVKIYFLYTMDNFSLIFLIKFRIINSVKNLQKRMILLLFYKGVFYVKNLFCLWEEASSWKQSQSCAQYQ